MNITTLHTKLKELLNEDNLLKLARKSGFLQRQRCLSPMNLILSLIQTLSTHTHANLADVHRTLGAISEHALQYKSFYKQVAKKQLTDFLQMLVEQATSRWFNMQLNKNDLKKYPFKNIEMHDGSTLRCHPKLVSVFKSRFTKTMPSAIEIHLTLNLLTGVASYCGIDADKESERHYQPYSYELKNTLVLMDAGYFDIKYCHEIDINQGFYIIRAKRNIKPNIENAYDAQGKLITSLTGKSVKYLRLQQGEVMDLDVSWDKYDGKFRLIAFWDQRKKSVNYLMSNLKREQVSLIEMIELYGLRWQIELFFKELKSYSSLKTLSTTNPQIVRSMVFSSLLTLILKRYIGLSSGLIHNVFISTQKTARVTPAWIVGFIRALLQPSKLLAEIKNMTEFLAKNAKRAHLKRDRETLLLRLGLNIYPVLN